MTGNAAPHQEYQDPGDMPQLTIVEIRQEAMANPQMRARLHVQVSEIAQVTSRTGDPFYKVEVSDSEGTLELRVWSSMAVFNSCSALRRGLFIEITGEFSHHDRYGLEARDWHFRALTPTEEQAVLSGSASLRAKQDRDFSYIEKTLNTLNDPRLHTVCRIFLEDFGSRFRRTAAARTYHHARRGGLVEHVAQMMRLADAIAGVYPTLNRDLLLAGVLFHDCGKLWENSYPEKGFTMPYDPLGEMLGHINIGIEIVNRFWSRLAEMPEWEEWRSMDPPADDTRNHLLHLIASHHGTREFGAPVEPKTPEAFTLHYIDNMDAKLEMLDGVYRTAPLIGKGIYERIRPLTTNLVEPLAHVAPQPRIQEETPESADQATAEPEGEQELDYNDAGA